MTSPHKPPAVAPNPARNVVSRIVSPSPDVTGFGGAKPILRGMSTNAAGQDNSICRPLGYPCRAVTLWTPGATSNTGPAGASGGNTDSVWLDLEEISIPNIVAGQSLNGPVELVPGACITIEETDAGWIHFGSPTANQVLFVSVGGPTLVAGLKADKAGTAATA